MIRELIKVASELDAAGFTKEADQVDNIIRKIAKNKSVVFPKNAPTTNVEWIQVTTEPNFRYLCENYSGYSSKPLDQQVKEQAALNALNVPGFNQNKIKRGDSLVMYTPEGGVGGP